MHLGSCRRGMAGGGWWTCSGDAAQKAGDGTLGGGGLPGSLNGNGTGGGRGGNLKGKGRRPNGNRAQGQSVQSVQSRWARAHDLECFDITLGGRAWIMEERLCSSRREPLDLGRRHADPSPHPLNTVSLGRGDGQLVPDFGGGGSMGVSLHLPAPPLPSGEGRGGSGGGAAWMHRYLGVVHRPSASLSALARIPVSLPLPSTTHPALQPLPAEAKNTCECNHHHRVPSLHPSALRFGLVTCAVL